MNARRHARSRAGSRKAVGGFVMITAVFLLVIVAMLGIMIVSLSTTQQVGQARDITGASARYAARAGLEWALYQVARNSTCNASTTVPALQGSAAPFSVQATCTSAGPFDEGGTMVTVYALTSTASRGTLGQIDFVERRMSAVISLP